MLHSEKLGISLVVMVMISDIYERDYYKGIAYIKLAIIDE